MKNIGVPVFITFVLLNSSCSKQTDDKSTDKLESWKESVADLNVYKSDLEIKKAEAQSFIETAEVHQVTRSNEEKARQLQNLNLHLAEIEFNIDSTETLIKIYIDSIQLKKE